MEVRPVAILAEGMARLAGAECFLARRGITLRLGCHGQQSGKRAPKIVYRMGFLSDRFG